MLVPMVYGTVSTGESHDSFGQRDSDLALLTPSILWLSITCVLL